MIQGQAAEHPLAPRASIKRRILAIYIDMLIFGSIWTLATLWIVPFLDNLFLRLMAFALVEAFIYPLRYSPGLLFLSIYLYPGESGYYLGVSPEIKRRESWPTMILATLLANDGWKAMIRWTSGYPARPYFGTVLDETLAPLADITLGVAEVYLAYLIFKLARAGLWSTLAYSALLIVSVALSWDLFPEYVEAYGRHRSEYLGREFNPEFAAVMTPAIRWGTIAAYGIAAAVVLLYRKRFTGSPRAS